MAVEKHPSILDTGVFSPFGTTIKCTNLYSETELAKALSEGVHDLLTNAVVADHTKRVFKEDFTLMNAKIFLGIIQAGAGLVACLVPFSTTRGVVIVAFATIFLIGVFVTTLFSQFVDDCLITELTMENAGKNKTRISVLGQVNRDTKTVRFAAAPACSLPASLRCGSYRLKLWMKEATWVALIKLLVFQNTRGHKFEFAVVHDDVVVSASDTTNDLDWANVQVALGPSGRAEVEHYSAKFKNLYRGGIQKSGITKKDRKPLPARELGYHGIIFDAPLTKYFDDLGYLLATPLTEDLRELVKRFLDMSATATN